MGTVYRAERVKLGRIVAVKVLHDILPQELSGRKRFELEAMAMAKLEHPHCASVLDVGVHNARPFVVMDFVSGQNLKDLIATGAQSSARSAEIVRQVLSGLAHAHELGIIHRDVKPANVVLSQKAGLGDHVKILDFGLARLLDSHQSLSTGIVVGTPAYMAPEQIRGDPLDARADLYACGVLLFELLTAEKPFHSEADDPIEVCRMHLSSPVPRLADKLPGGSFGELEAVVARALAKERDDRYPTAGAFAAALEVAVARPSRQGTLTIPPSGPIQLGSGNLFSPSVSSLEVRSTDVLAAMPDGRPAAAPRIGGATPPAGTAAAPAGNDGGPAPSTFFGVAVRAASQPAEAAASPSTDAESSTSVAVAVPGARRWRWLMAGSIAALIGTVAVVAVILTGDSTPVSPAPPAPPSPSEPRPSDGAREIATRATEMAAQGDREAALDLLRLARRQNPSNALLAYTTGRICFSKFYWSEGLRSFRDALRLEPSYRSDPELIKLVLRGFITTPSYNNDLAAFLREEIGSAAVPFLEETARDHPNPMIRSRAVSELRRYH